MSDGAQVAFVPYANLKNVKKGAPRLRLRADDGVLPQGRHRARSPARAKCSSSTRTATRCCAARWSSSSSSGDQLRPTTCCSSEDGRCSSNASALAVLLAPVGTRIRRTTATATTSKARPTREAAIQFSPELIGSVGYVEQPDAAINPDASSKGLRLIAGVRYKLSGIYEGIATRQPRQGRLPPPPRVRASARRDRIARNRGAAQGSRRRARRGREDPAHRRGRLRRAPHDRARSDGDARPRRGAAPARGRRSSPAVDPAAADETHRSPVRCRRTARPTPRSKRTKRSSAARRRSTSACGSASTSIAERQQPVAVLRRALGRRQPRRPVPRARRTSAPPPAAKSSSQSGQRPRRRRHGRSAPHDARGRDEARAGIGRARQRARAPARRARPDRRRREQALQARRCGSSWSRRRRSTRTSRRTCNRSAKCWEVRE